MIARSRERNALAFLGDLLFALERDREELRGVAPLADLLVVRKESAGLIFPYGHFVEIVAAAPVEKAPEEPISFDGLAAVGNVGHGLVGAAQRLPDVGIQAARRTIRGLNRAHRASRFFSQRVELIGDGVDFGSEVARLDVFGNSFEIVRGVLEVPRHLLAFADDVPDLLTMLP